MNICNNTKKAGDKSTAITLAMLVEAGYSVSIPWGDNQRYDLIAERDGRFWRIQCKTGWLHNGCVKFNTANKSTQKGKIVRKAYHGQIEHFLVWCPDNRILYCIPVNNSPNTGMMLRLEDTATTINYPRIKWANKYVFDGILP